MQPFIGEIKMFAGNYAPQGWLLCDGSELPISQYPNLFAVLSTTFGGNGAQTFCVPDFRGRLPVGQGAGTGLTPRPIGQYFGTEAVVVPADGWPPHAHGLAASPAAAATAMPGTGVMPAVTAADVPLYDAKTNPMALDPRAIMSTGGGMPHANIMPSSCVNFIIAASGLFPSGQ